MPPLDFDIPPASHAERSNRHVANQTTEHCLGALAAQKAIDELRSGGADREAVWLRFVELAAGRGWKSAAARAFVLELAKRIS